MSIKVIKGNIFTTKCNVIVNTVNTVGVMGAGIALECRLRYPEMYNRYVNLCENKKLDIGILWLYKSTDKWLLNFPTKKHWKYPSKIEYLESGLDKFINTYESKGIESIAFPMLGADKGGISISNSLNIMEAKLQGLPIDIEIYKYDPTAKDDLYDTTKSWVLSRSIDEISDLTKLRKDSALKLVEAMKLDEIVQLNQLAKVNGIGIKALEKIFMIRNISSKQNNLF